MKANLKKHKGTTTDNEGCDFPYTCYQTFNENTMKYDRIYVDNLFRNQAPTLKELKKIMSNPKNFKRF
jgi:hypothetical protein